MDGGKMQLSKLAKMDDPRAVMAEVRTIVWMMWPDFDFQTVLGVFEDIVDLYGGRYPGYQASNTRYHDLQHTTDALLAVTRLAHGAFIAKECLSRENLGLALVATLMHDTGYIQTDKETHGTGAQYTLNHVDRSIVFMDGYFSAHGFTREEFADASAMLHCTGLNVKIDQICFSGPQVELLGKMLGTADLLGQMGDRTYLEKLLYLFYEFVEAGIGGYGTELDLLEKTIDFYELTQQRLSRDLGGVTRFLPVHFAARFGVEKDMYSDSIQKNMRYLKHLLQNRRKDYRLGLRRSGIVRDLEKEGL